MPKSSPNSPITPPPFQDFLIEGPGPSRPGVAIAGDALLDKAIAQVFAPDLNSFTPNNQFASEAETKRATVFQFMKSPDYTRLGAQTESALREAGFLDVVGKPVLMNQDALAHCMRQWGLSSRSANPENLDPDLYELYQIGLPTLAKAVAVARELRTQSTAVDAQSQGEVRQVLRSLFAHGLTVCTPGVIQNIEDAWKCLTNAVNPPDLAGEFKKRTVDAAVRVLSKHAYQRFASNEFFANNQIHIVTALKNALAGKYGLEKTDDKYASAEYATRLLGADGNALNEQLDQATAPKVLFQNLADDLMQQVRNRCQAEGVLEPGQMGDVINEMARKFTELYVDCSPYTIGKFDPDLGVITQPSDSSAPLAITLLQQGQRQGLFKIAESQVEIRQSGLPSLNLLFIDDLVSLKDIVGSGPTAAVMVPLSLEDLLPVASTWLEAQLNLPEQWNDRRASAANNQGLVALFEALQNSKGGVWANVWKGGSGEIPVRQGKAFLDVMLFQTPDLHRLVAPGRLSSGQILSLVHQVAHGNQALFNQIPKPVMEHWLKGLSKRYDFDSRYSPIEQTLSHVLYDMRFTNCKPLVEIALQWGVKVYFPVVAGDQENGRASMVGVASPEWVGQMVELATVDKRAALLEAMVRSTLVEMTSGQDKDEIGILNAIRQLGGCVFANQASSWQRLLEYNFRKDLPRDNLNKLLNWTAQHAVQQWQPQALSLLFHAIENDKVDLASVETYLNQASRALDSYADEALPGLGQVHQNYEGAARQLLARQDFRGLQLALKFVNHFQTKGFPKVHDSTLMASLETAINNGYEKVVELASTAKLVPISQTGALVTAICWNVQKNDEILHRMANHVIPTGFEQSGSAENWRLFDRAIAEGMPKLGKVLLEKMIGTGNLNKLDSNGFAVLHHAARENNPKLIRSLVAAGADINIKTSESHNQKTPLHYAFLEHHKEAKEALIGLNADTNAKDLKGRTPRQLDRLIGKLRRMI